MMKSRIFFRKLLENIQEDIRLEKNDNEYFSLRRHLFNTNKLVEDKYTKSELRRMTVNLTRAVKELTTLSDKYIPVGVVILSEYDESPEDCMFE